MRFCKVFINIDTKRTESWYEWHTRNIVITNLNNIVSKLYGICDPCKMTKGWHRSYETIGKVFTLVIFIVIFYQEKL